MKNRFTELLRNNFRCGRMLHSRALNLAGRYGVRLKASAPSIHIVCGKEKLRTHSQAYAPCGRERRPGNFVLQTGDDNDRIAASE